MGRYTDTLDDQAMCIDPMEEDYQEKLLETARLFRGFADALTSFLCTHGYEKDRDDTEAKVYFLRERFRSAGDIPVPRNLRSWFDGNKKISRKTAFQVCFALGLDAEDTNDFFRRVQFERSFDCHTISEAVYYFCLRKGKSYWEAEVILEQVGTAKRSRTLPVGEIVYTTSLQKDIESLPCEDDLVAYLKARAEDFGYHNATAIRLLQHLWARISGPDGLAEREGRLIDRMMNSAHTFPANGQTAESRQKGETGQAEQDFRQDELVISERDASTWTIYAQIMGLDRYQAGKYAASRSLTPVLTENILLPLRAADCFPSRQTIDNILRGLSGDYEPLRKMIIFLSFYSFWAGRIVEAGDAYVEAGPGDSSRCLALMEKYLTDAGYPPLYYGNPYDWIFLWAMNDTCPLPAFRGYILEVFDVSQS